MDKFGLIKIAKNSSYELMVDKSQNTFLISFFGMWDKTSQLEYYLEDIKYSLEKVSSGFSIIIDLNLYRGSASEHISLHAEAQKLAIGAGLNKTAVVMQNNPMLKATVDLIFRQSGIEAAYFNNMPAAEQWISS